MNRRAKIYLPLKQRQRWGWLQSEGSAERHRQETAVPWDTWNPSEIHMVMCAPPYTGRACEKTVDNNKLLSIERILIYKKPLRNMVPNSGFQKANWSSLGNEKSAKLRNSRPKVEEKLLSCCGTCISYKRGKGSEAAQQPKAHLTTLEVGACRNSQWNGTGEKSKGTNAHGRSKASGYHLRQSSDQMTPHRR